MSQGFPAQIQKKYAATASRSEVHAVMGSIISQEKATYVPYWNKPNWAPIVAKNSIANLVEVKLAFSLQFSIKPEYGASASSINAISLMSYSRVELIIIDLREKESRKNIEISFFE